MIMNHLLSEIPEAGMGIVNMGPNFWQFFLFYKSHLINGKGREVVLFKIMSHASLPCVITLL